MAPSGPGKCCPVSAPSMSRRTTPGSFASGRPRPSSTRVESNINRRLENAWLGAGRGESPGRGREFTNGLVRAPDAQIQPHGGAPYQRRIGKSRGIARTGRSWVQPGGRSGIRRRSWPVGKAGRGLRRELSRAATRGRPRGGRLSACNAQAGRTRVRRSTPWDRHSWAGPAIHPLEPAGAGEPGSGR